jgi:serine protease Do
MSVRSLNWLKFGGLVGLAFVLGLMFAGLLDLPRSSAAQGRDGGPAEVIPAVQSTVPAAAVAPLATLSDAFATVAEQVRPSVVYIRARRTGRELTRTVPPGFEEFFGRQPRGRGEPPVETGAGSGFLVSKDGYILTNSHVVDGAEQVTVRLIDRREFTARVVGTDPNTDVAVIKIDPGKAQVTPARLGSSSATRVGEWVLAVGNPLGENLNFTVTSGIVSAKGRGQLPLPGRGGTSIQDFIQTDAAINRGNSGGPLINVRGEVIGINSAIFSQTGFNVGYAFAIPIDLARNVMDQLITKGKVERAALGVLVGETTQEDADYVKLPEIRGAKINEFSGANSPARRAGLEAGDIIVSVDGEPVEYVAQLQQLVGFRKPGEVVKVEVARKGGVRRTYDVRLVAQTEAAELAEAGERAEPGAPADTEGSVLKDRLGIGVSTVSPTLARELGLPAGMRGVLVDEVDPYGPADNLLFPPSQLVNVITEIEGRPVRSEGDLRDAIRALKAGEVVSLTVYLPQANGGRGQTGVVRVRLR